MRDPLTDPGWMILAGAQNGEGNGAAAHASMLRGLQIDPGSEYGNHTLGATELLDAKPAKALAALQRIPDSFEGWAGLARA